MVDLWAGLICWPCRFETGETRLPFLPSGGQRSDLRRSRGNKSFLRPAPPFLRASESSKTRAEAFIRA